jgi:hypothetical protein
MSRRCFGGDVLSWRGIDVASIGPVTRIYTRQSVFSRSKTISPQQNPSVEPPLSLPALFRRVCDGGSTHAKGDSRAEVLIRV